MWRVAPARENQELLATAYSPDFQGFYRLEKAALGLPELKKLAGWLPHGRTVVEAQAASMGDHC